MMLSSRSVVLAALINSEEGAYNNNVRGLVEKSVKICLSLFFSIFGVWKTDIDPKTDDLIMMTPLMDGPSVRILRTETN